MERLKRYLERVPDASHFPTLPEIEDRLRLIHARHPETTALKVIGTSRGGRPLTMLSVGVGSSPETGTPWSPAGPTPTSPPAPWGHWPSATSSPQIRRWSRSWAWSGTWCRASIPTVRRSTTVGTAGRTPVATTPSTSTGSRSPSSTSGPSSGMLSSTEYALPYGTVGVVQEPPMWVHAAMADDSLSDQTFRQVHEAAHAVRDGLAVRMAGWVAVVQAHHDLDTPRGRGVLEQLRYVRQPNPGPEPADQRCTVAYARSVAEYALLDTLRCTGHLTALLRDEARDSPPAPGVASVLGEVSSILTGSAEQGSELTFVGLGPAVRAHVGMALTTASLL